MATKCSCCSWKGLETEQTCKGYRKRDIYRDPEIGGVRTARRRHIELGWIWDFRERLNGFLIWFTHSQYKKIPNMNVRLRFRHCQRLTSKKLAFYGKGFLLEWDNSQSSTCRMDLRAKQLPTGHQSSRWSPWSWIPAVAAFQGLNSLLKTANYLSVFCFLLPDFIHEFAAPLKGGVIPPPRISTSSRVTPRIQIGQGHPSWTQALMIHCPDPQCERGYHHTTRNGMDLEKLWQFKIW